MNFLSTFEGEWDAECASCLAVLFCMHSSWVIEAVTGYLSEQGRANLQQLRGVHPDDLEWPKGTPASKKALVRAAYERIKELHPPSKKGSDAEPASGAATIDER